MTDHDPYEDLPRGDPPKEWYEQGGESSSQSLESDRNADGRSQIDYERLREIWVNAGPTTEWKDMKQAIQQEVRKVVR